MRMRCAPTHPSARAPPTPTPPTSQYLMASCDSLKGGLNKLAEDLEVERVGPMHQAGSDSLLTASTFFKLRSVYFEGKIPSSSVGILFGLGVGGSPGGGGAGP